MHRGRKPQTQFNYKKFQYQSKSVVVDGKVFSLETDIPSVMKEWSRQFSSDKKTSNHQSSRMTRGTKSQTIMRRKKDEKERVNRKIS